MAVQWHRVLDRALAESAVVGVADAVAAHVGRVPTRSEMSAARRAAHRFAATGEARVAVLSSVVDGSKRQVLVLTDPDVDLDDVAALRRASATPARKAGTPQGPGTRDAAQRAESLLTQVSQASRAAGLLPVAQIEPAHAKLLAADLIEAVAVLAVFAADLTRRSRQHTPTVRE